MKVAALVCLSFVLISLGSSCSKKNEPVKPKEPEVFSFNETNVVVSAADIQLASDATKTVKADFNLDGGEDIALVDKDSEGREVVSVFIRAPDRTTATAKALGEISYFKGGSIRPPEEATIRGVMIRRSEKYSDLVILYAFPYKGNETVHYRNDGKTFSRLDDEDIDSQKTQK